MSDAIYHERSLKEKVYPHLRMAIELVDPLLPKIAVEAGCGAGRDALFLVDHGFTVYAFDKSEVTIAKLHEMGQAHVDEKLFLRACSFEKFEYPKSSLISACSSLFFCHPTLFPEAWNNISKALLPGGIFCGHFMGPDDSWAKLDRGDLTIHTQADMKKLFDSNYEIIDVYEHNFEGITLVGKKKHWHTYSVVARKIT